MFHSLRALLARGRGGGGQQGSPVTAILVINTGVFAAWTHASGDRQRSRLMYDHFTTSYLNTFDNGRLYTLITSAFSHHGPWHFAANMFGLYSFGYPLCHMMGNRAFLTTYLVGAVMGGIANACTPFLIPSSWPTGGTFNKRNSLSTPSLGASGAISSVITFYSLVLPRASVLLYGIVPVPVGLLAAGLVSFDAYGLYSGVSPGTGHACHIGGAAVGVASFLILRRRI